MWLFICQNDTPFIIIIIIIYFKHQNRRADMSEASKTGYTSDSCVSGVFSRYSYSPTSLHLVFTLLLLLLLLLL